MCTNLPRAGARFLVAIAIASLGLACWQFWQFVFGQMSRDVLVIELGCTGVALVAAFLASQFIDSERPCFESCTEVARLWAAVGFGLMAMAGLAGSFVFETWSSNVAAARVVAPATTTAGHWLWMWRMNHTFGTTVAILVMAVILSIGLFLIVGEAVALHIRGALPETATAAAHQAETAQTEPDLIPVDRDFGILDRFANPA